MKPTGLLLLGLSLFLLPLTAPAQDTSPYQKWTHGPSTDPGFFPIAVWCQDPRNAEKFAQAGINIYLGLWEGPTEDQLAALKKSGMKLICAQNDVGLKHLDDPTIIGWMHGDEPDNAQENPGGKGYGPPIAPEKILSEYNDTVKADPTRPVMLNLGMAVAWDGWIGRGARTNHPEDYPEYIKGGDIISFDIYPVAADRPEIADKLWLVPYGVDRLLKWTEEKKIVWNCLECTHISTPDKKATPQQVKCEAWMALIHGSQGLIYFVHEFAPKFKEAALLQDPEMLAGVTTLNKQIASLAPALNSPTVDHGTLKGPDGKDADSTPQVDFVVKKSQGSTYVFAAAMRNMGMDASFSLPLLKAGTTVTVIDENRTITAKDGSFTDTFAPWDVHLYQIKD